MIVFRWIMGIITGLLASGAAGSMLIYMLNGDDRLGELSRRLGRLLGAAALFWFNLEIWGRVIWTLIHWP